MLETYMYAPIGFLAYEFLRLYKRHINNEEIFPKTLDYYILMLFLVSIITIIAYGIKVNPEVAALLLGATMPSGFKQALEAIRGNPRLIDDIPPNFKLPFHKRFCNMFLNKYFRE
jgi:hypothetical protein